MNFRSAPAAAGAVPYPEALAGFEVPARRTYEAELPPGRQHKSMSALTGMEGRKP